MQLAKQTGACHQPNATAQKVMHRARASHMYAAAAAAIQRQRQWRTACPDTPIGKRG